MKKFFIIMLMLFAFACTDGERYLQVDEDLPVLTDEETADTDVMEDTVDTENTEETADPEVETDLTENDVEDTETEDEVTEDTEETDQDTEEEPDNVLDSSEPDEPDSNDETEYDDSNEEEPDLTDEDTEVPDTWDPPVKDVYGTSGMYCIVYQDSTVLECGGSLVENLFISLEIPEVMPVILDIDPDDIVKAVPTSYSITFLMNDGTLKIWGLTAGKPLEPVDRIPLTDIDIQFKNIWSAADNLLYGVRQDDDELMYWGNGYAFYDLLVPWFTAVPQYARDPESGNDWSSITGVTDAGSNCIMQNGKLWCNRHNYKGNNAADVDVDYRLEDGEWIPWLVPMSRTVPLKTGASTVEYITNAQCYVQFEGGVRCWGFAPENEIRRSDPDASIFELMCRQTAVNFTAPAGLKFGKPMAMPGYKERQLLYTADQMWVFERGSYDHETGMSDPVELTMPFNGIKTVLSGGNGWMIVTDTGEVWTLSSWDLAFERIRKPYSTKH